MYQLVYLVHLLYRVCNNSSGFEHVFVGETRGQDVIGFHNWIQLYLQEKAQNIDYRGYFRRGTVSFSIIQIDILLKYKMTSYRK